MLPPSPGSAKAEATTRRWVAIASSSIQASSLARSQCSTITPTEKRCMLTATARAGSAAPIRRWIAQHSSTPAPPPSSSVGTGSPK